jgi:D-alanine-D-alanine ligase
MGRHSPVRVLVLHNQPVLPPDHPDAESEIGILDNVAEVEAMLQQAGFQVSRLGVGYDPGVLVSGIARHRPQVVFNLFEGLADYDHVEAVAAGILDWLGVPFTGSPYSTLSLTKPMFKHLFRGAGLPTPDFLVVDRLPVECPLDWPVIVKPGTRHASLGLDQNSVVSDHRALNERVAYLLEHYGAPVLVESYVPGREFNVAVIDNPDPQTLPIAEIVYLDRREGYWPILTYEAKWDTGSEADEMTPPVCPADIEPELADKLRDLALRCYRLVGCRDYARVDFRVDPAGQPYILEINANPDFSSGAGLARMLRAAGIDHAQFACDLVKNALARGGEPLRHTGQPHNQDLYQS